jgi:uncharacterized membrane protein YeiH
MNEIETVVFVLEMVGVAAFAVSGVMAAVARELDLLGALVLGAITSVGGGVIRDILLGVLPPAMFVDPRYVIAAVGVSLVTFVVALCLGDRFLQRIERLGPLINALDAVGLGIFVTVGVDAAVRAGYGDNAFLAVFVGTMTGVGGGILRDQLVGRVPMVLQKHVYVLAAIAGAIAYYVMLRLDLLRPVALCLSSAIVVVIRLLAAHYRWNLPHIRRS